jgi:hypothetical protein
MEHPKGYRIIALAPGMRFCDGDKKTIKKQVPMLIFYNHHPDWLFWSFGCFNYFDKYCSQVVATACGFQTAI